MHKSICVIPKSRALTSGTRNLAWTNTCVSDPREIPRSAGESAELRDDAFVEEAKNKMGRTRMSDPHVLTLADDRQPTSDAGEGARATRAQYPMSPMPPCPPGIGLEPESGRLNSLV